MLSNTLCSVLDSVTAAFPGRIALSDAQGDTTYAELEGRATATCQALQRAGVTCGATIAIDAAPSRAMIAGLVAIVRMGCAYLPLDEQAPPHRNAIALSATRASLVLVDGTPPNLPPRFHVPTLDLCDVPATTEQAPIARPVLPEFPAYVMFTSGSTGGPKGVVIPHRGVIRLVVSNACFDFCSTDTFVQLAPMAFDAATLEIWGALLNGARLVLPEHRRLAPSAIGDLVAEEGITVLYLTTGLFHEVALEGDLSRFRDLRYLVTGGDVLSTWHANQIAHALPHTVVLNGYGPTENTTFTTCYRIFPSGVAGARVPIGTAISGSTVDVLDHSFNRVQIGQAGELWAGGDGVALGYIGDPRLTADRFRPHDRSTRPGARMYGTGDRVVLKPDGNHDFLGRLDGQVKLSGFRVEIAEVEAALAAIAGVSRALVVIQPRPGLATRLLAFFTGTMSETAARDEVATVLPRYAIPSVITRLEAFPLTGNGKIDRERLASLVPVERPEMTTSFVAPEHGLEAKIADSVSRLLAIDRVGAEDDFFELGGQSLLGVQLLREISRTTGVTISALEFYEAPTARGLARAVATHLRSAE